MVNADLLAIDYKKDFPLLRELDAEGVLAVFSEKLETNLRARLFVYDLNQKLFDVFPAVVALFEFEYIVHGKSVDFFPHGFGEPHHEFALQYRSKIDGLFNSKLQNVDIELAVRFIVIVNHVVVVHRHKALHVVPKFRFHSLSHTSLPLVFNAD